MASDSSHNEISKKFPSHTTWFFVTTILLLLTMVTRVLWMHAFPTQPTAPIDAEGFFLLGRNILNGQGFAIAWDQPYCSDTVRTPLYPLFLALAFFIMGPNVKVIVLLHILLEVVTCAITIRLGRIVSKLSRKSPKYGFRCGVTAGFLYIFNGTTQRFTGLLFSETLLLLIMSCAVLMTCRALYRPTLRTVSSAGLCWALSILTKPNVQFLVIFIGLLMTLAILRIYRANRQRLSIVSGYWLVLMITLLPWLVRNKMLTSRWMISSAFDENIARVAYVTTQAETLGVFVEPWTETWEYIYDLLVMKVSLKYGWLFSNESRFSCGLRMRQKMQIAREARHFLSHHIRLYLKVHMRAVLKSILDPGHRIWYAVITGQSWTSTGVVPDIWSRIAWSMKRKAVGDAVLAFLGQRILDIPPIAGLIWWVLLISRLVIWILVIRGLWRMKPYFLHMCLLTAILLYILILPGPIAHDRFYVPGIPVVCAILEVGLLKVNKLVRNSNSNS